MLKKLKTENAELTVQLNAEIEQKQILVNQILALTGDKQILDKQVQELVVKYNSLVSNVDTISARIDKASDCYRQIRHEKAELETRVLNASVEFKKIRMENRNLKKKVSDLEDEKKALQQKLSEYEKESKADKQKVAELQDKLAKALAWYKVMQNNKSAEEPAA